MSIGQTSILMIFWSQAKPTRPAMTEATTIAHPMAPAKSSPMYSGLDMKRKPPMATGMSPMMMAERRPSAVRALTSPRRRPR